MQDYIEEILENLAIVTEQIDADVADTDGEIDECASL